MATNRRPLGRPPQGLKAGERVADYERMSIRLPAETKNRLMALSSVTGEPAWLIVMKAIEAAVEKMPAPDRRLIEDLVKRRLEGRGTTGAR